MRKKYHPIELENNDLIEMLPAFKEAFEESILVSSFYLLNNK